MQRNRTAGAGKGVFMKEIRSKEFEHYEYEAAYFAYTHDNDDYDYDAWSSVEEYEALDRKVIEFVQERGARDRADNRPKLKFEQFSRLIVSEGLLTREQVDTVMIHLFVDYLCAYSSTTKEKE